MSASTIPAVAPVNFMRDVLRAEAAIEPTPVSTKEVTKETQIIAIYGKGGTVGGIGLCCFVLVGNQTIE